MGEKFKTFLNKFKKNIKKNKTKKAKNKKVKEKKLKFKKVKIKKEKIKKEKRNIIITKEACIMLFVVLEIILFNIVLTASEIVPYEEYNSVEFLALVFFNPAVLIAFGFIYSFNYGFSWFLPAILVIAFIPSIISFLPVSFSFYIPIYFIFVISSELCGVSIIKVKKV